MPLFVLVVRTDGGLEQTEGGHWLLTSLLGLEVAVEQQLIGLQAHVELDPVLVLGSALTDKQTDILLHCCT